MKSITTLHFRKNNLIQVFVWIFFLTCINLNAQKIYSVLNESWNNNNWEKESQTLNTYDGNSYLTNSLIQRWDTSSGIWENNIQINYTNNIDGTVSQSIAQTWDKGTGSWNDFQRNLYTYNAAKKEQTITSQIWAGVWLNSSKITSSYDGSSYLTNSLIQSWDFISSIWKNISQTNFTNNPNGTVNQSITQSWNSSNVWVNTERTSYTYTAGNKVLVATTEIWTGANWLNDSKDTNTYDASNYLINSLSQTWNTSSGIWMNSSQLIFTNNASGNPIQMVSQSWESNTSIWNNEIRSTFNYSLGISDFIKEKDFVIFPNPATDIITVKRNNSLKSAYSISDQTGRVIQNGSIHSEISSLDIGHLSKGIYFLSIDKKYLKIVKD